MCLPKWTYGYDDKNELITAVDKNNSGTVLTQATYTYDAFGNRTEKDVWTSATGTVTTKFAMDGWDPALAGTTGNSNWNVLADLTSTGALSTRYLRGDGVEQLWAHLDYSGGTFTPYWYLTDRLGSVRDVINNSATVEDTVYYDAFGNITSETNASYRAGYAWTGRELDAETGLQYNRARYYDSHTGRWISQDPLGFSAGDSNLYRYVHNDPTTDTDPSGMIPPGAGLPKQKIPRPVPAPGLGPIPVKNAPVAAPGTYVLKYGDLTIDGGMDGRYWWSIDWQLDHPSPKGGYVIQEITFSWSIKDCDGNSVKFSKRHDLTSPLTYFEVWKVPPNSKQTQPVSDRWIGFERPKTKGWINIDASAWFLEDWVLPDSFVPSNPKTLAGDLNSTTDAVKLPSANSNIVSRGLLATWDSLNGPSKTNLLITSSWRDQ